MKASVPIIILLVTIQVYRKSKHWKLFQNLRWPHYLNEFLGGEATDGHRKWTKSGRRRMLRVRVAGVMER